MAAKTPDYRKRIAYLKDVKSNSTDGGTATAGSYESRTLNTLEGDTSFVTQDTEGGTRTIGTNGTARRFILQPGTYHIEAEAPVFFADRHKAKLRNITSGTDTLLGTTQYLRTNLDDGQSQSVTTSNIRGTFSISAATVFEIQHRVQTTRATNGYGIAGNFGDPEVYTQVKIEKIA